MEKEDLYAVLDLNNECSQGDLRLAYKNLVLKWHPDRFREDIEKDEAKMKFQSIQRAYSVLSDSNKRLLYDVGAYDSDDDETGMADFINEMVTLMAQTQSTGDETVEEFEKLFEELLKDDVNQFKTCSSLSPYDPFTCTSTSVHSRDLSNTTPNKINVDDYCCTTSTEIGSLFFSLPLRHATVSIPLRRAAVLLPLRRGLSPSLPLRRRPTTIYHWLISTMHHFSVFLLVSAVVIPVTASFFQTNACS